MYKNKKVKKNSHFDRKQGLYEKYFKRVLDIIISLLVIIFLSPVMLLLAILIKIRIGSPIIFKQERPGKGEVIFTMYKFRTMSDKRDESGDLLPDNQRLVPFGNFLRSTSLDELPEIFNVLLGQMSIIGPRPLLVKYLPLYNEFQKKRHEVMPGLVGLAGVTGRNNQSWENKFKKDIEYVENMSFKMDISIFLKAILVVIKRDGVNLEGNVTTTEFKGNGDKLT